MPEIIIKQGSLRFHLNWELIHKDDRCYRFKVTPIANPDKFIILECNEPLIRVKLKLKHRRIDWKVIEGNQMKESTLQMIIDQITGYRPPEAPKVPMPSTLAQSRKKGREAGPTLGERVMQKPSSGYTR